jgi:hypothetical protein
LSTPTFRPRAGRGLPWRIFTAAVVVLLWASGLTALTALVACDSGDPAPSPSPSGPLEYTNDDLGFSISRDAAFEQVYQYEAPLARFKIGFLDVDTAAEGESPDTLLVTGIGEKATGRLATPEGRKRLLDEVVDEMIAAGQGTKRDWKKTTINGLPAAVSGKRDKRTKSQRVTCIVVGARDIYVLTGDASDETFDEKLPLFGAAFETFREL